MSRLCLLLVLAACSRAGGAVETSEPETTEVTEVIVTADGVVECINDGTVRSSDLRGC